MSAQHTRGPWVRGHALTNGQACIVGDGDTVVCLLPDETTGCTFNEANARLIAAAPDLLALAREIAENAILAGMGIGHQARKVIAAATGENA